MQQLLQTWACGPSSIPPAICDDGNGTLNVCDVNLWMWFHRTMPMDHQVPYKVLFWSLFQQPNCWAELIGTQWLYTSESILCQLVKDRFIWPRNPELTKELNLALWVGCFGGVTPKNTQQSEKFVARHKTCECYNKPTHCLAATCNHRHPNARATIVQVYCWLCTSPILPVTTMSIPRPSDFGPDPRSNPLTASFLVFFIFQDLLLPPYLPDPWQA